MIRHVVVFRWNDSVTDEQLAAMSAALDALPGAIPEIVSYRHGRDLGIGAGNFQYSITADFADADGFATYRDHPRAPTVHRRPHHRPRRRARRRAVRVRRVSVTPGV
jgi:hypothetical protein